MFDELKTILSDIGPGNVADRPVMDWYRRHKDYFFLRDIVIFDSDLQDRHFGFLLRCWNKDRFKEIEHYYYYSSYPRFGWYNCNGELSNSNEDIDRLIDEIKELGKK